MNPMTLIRTQRWLATLVALILPVVLVFALAAPSPAYAFKELGFAGGGNDEDPDGSEGDPLDTNDFGGGDDGGNVHDNDRVEPIIIPLGPDFRSGGIILVIPVYSGASLSFQFLFWSPMSVVSGGSDVK